MDRNARLDATLLVAKTLKELIAVQVGSGISGFDAKGDPLKSSLWLVGARTPQADTTYQGTPLSSNLREAVDRLPLRCAFWNMLVARIGVLASDINVIVISDDVGCIMQPRCQ